MKNLRKSIYLNIILLLLVIFLIFILVYNFKLTKLEKIKLDEFDKKVSYYLEDYISYTKLDTDNYIAKQRDNILNFLYWWSRLNNIKFVIIKYSFNILS